MSLIRPKPRHADEVSDAFEQLFSASPMSKLLSVERGYSVNTSSLSVVKPSPFKLPAMVTPVAKIFLQLKRSEGTLSVDSDAVSRCDSRQFSTSNTDSDSSRLSFEQQQAQRHESLHFSTDAYLGNQALGPGSYMNCEERLGTDTGSMVLRFPRVCLERLDESVYKPEESVVRGQESLPENDEEESADIALLSDGENNGFALEENGEMAELDSGGKMMSCCGVQENDEADYQAEPRNHRLGKQTGECPQEDNVQRFVRKRKRTKARKRNRSFVPEESESSDAENERRRREPRRRRHHLEEIKDDAKDDTVAKNVGRDERGVNGCGSKSSDAENEGRRPESHRRRHQLEERINDARDNVVDRDSDEQGRSHHESSDAENEGRPELCTTRRHLKEITDNTKDNATARNLDERGGNDTESSDAENEGRRTAPGRRRHRLEERRDDAKDDGSEEQEEDGCHGNVDSEEQQRWQSQENEPYDEFKANRRTTEAHLDDRRQSTGDESDKQDTEPRDMGRSDHRKDSDRSVSEDEEEQPRNGPPEEDQECDDTRGTSRKDRAVNDVTRSQSATYDENTSSKKSLRKGALERIVSRLGGGSNPRRLRSSHHTRYELADDDENTTRHAKSFPQEKDGTRVQSTLTPSTTDEESDRSDKEHATEVPVAVSCDTPPFRRVTRVMAANRRLGIQEKARKPEDRICAKTASVDKPRPVGQKEAKKKTTAARDLSETPVNSRKLLKVSAVRQHTLDNWTILPLGRNIIVDGHRPDDPANQFWHSNAIVKRISSHAVCTVSGTVYTLRGKMEEEKALAEGFSKKVIAAFKKGFPPTWKEIIQEHNKGTTTCSRPAKTRPSEMKTPVEQCKTKPRRKPNPNTAAPETPVTISSLPKTRSGRHVIPQLAWWTGQRVTIDPNNYTVDITPGTPDTQCPVVPSSQRHKKADTSHSRQPNRKYVTKVQKQEVTRPGRRFENNNKSGRGNNDRESQKGRHDVNADRRKQGAPTRKLRQHREESTDARNSEMEASINTPMQRLFSEHTVEVNGRNVAAMDDTDDQQNTQSMDPVTRKQVVSKDRVRTLLFLERRERNGVPAPGRAGPTEVPQVRRGDSLSDDTGSCSSDSTNNTHGPEKRGKPVSQLDNSYGDRSASEASSSDANAGVSLDKRRQATLGSVANLQRDILRIVTKNKRTTARQRLAGKALPCYSPRAENPVGVGDSSSSKSDDDDAGVGGGRRNMTALGRTPRHQVDTQSTRRLGTHAGDMMPLDVLQTEERVSRRSTPSDAPRNTPASHFRENMTDDILCRSVEHKRLFSGEDAGVRRHGDKPCAKRNGRSDTSKDRDHVDPYGKERNTKNIKAQVSQKRSRNKNGKLYSPKKKDALHPRTKGKVSSKRQVLSDDSNDEQATIERQVLSRQKALKIPEKTKRKTAAAPGDKPDKLLGNFVGGVGTLKRKRQLREFVEQHECGHENDLFDSTPFQQRKVRKVTTQLGKNTVDDFFDVTAARMSFTTPGTTPSSSLRSAWLPTSDKKTPSSSMAASPLMSEAVNRNAVDRYVNRLKRVAKRRGTKHGLSAAATARTEVSGPQRQTGQPLASVSPSVFQMANRSGDADSSNADDYYFSDGSDST